MTVPIARRKFVVALAGAATWSLVARAQQREKIDHLCVFTEPRLVLRTSRNDHHIALAAPLSVPRRDSILPLSIHTICSFG